MIEPNGYCCLVLHAHLPYVRHSEAEAAMEELWFFEAMTETYIPLVEMMDGWHRDGVDFRLTLSISPTLLSMLLDPVLRERYSRHLEQLIGLAEREVERTQLMPLEQKAARYYLERFGRCRQIWLERYQGDLVRPLRRHLNAGNLELITAGATHAFLPLLQHQSLAVRAQIRVARDMHVKHFGRPPGGLWSSECGYYPGLDDLLAEADLHYFFVDAHALLHGSPRPKYGTFAPVFCPAGVAAFARDQLSLRSVWSADEGYPGDPAYREFYRDIGFELDPEYLGFSVHRSGARLPTGIKYHRVTDRKRDLAEKQPYDVDAALARAREHAEDFVRCRQEQCDRLQGIMDRPALVVSPYDAELFGHWWYEGIDFLDDLMRRLCEASPSLKPITPSQYLAAYPVNQIVTPTTSSWGAGGYAAMWLGDENAWIYRHVHSAAERMIELSRRYSNLAHGLLRRALNQMARELLLAQSSDWAFIIQAGTMTEYAERRMREHLANFNRIYNQVAAMRCEEAFIQDLEQRNGIFPDLQFEVFCERFQHD